MNLKLKDFDYKIPDELVAQVPISERSHSRLLVRDRQGNIEHKLFSDLSKILKPGTHLVYNDSRVLPGRLLFRTSSGGKLELMLLKPLEPDKNIWLAIGRPFKKLKTGMQIDLDPQCSMIIRRRFLEGPQPKLEVQFSKSYTEFLDWLEDFGHVPLPPYITRKTSQPAKLSSDKDRYQTVYAEHRGSVAAPTAGLHFTSELWQQLQEVGIITVPLTLHVGGGTFLPVKTENISEHQMHSESYRISSSSWLKIKNAQTNDLPIIAVGTTSLRCLESFARKLGEIGGDAESILDRWQETNLFIYPQTTKSKFKPWGIQGLITNFHQPESSLLMLISALIGYEETKHLYQTAMEARYRFYSYGDSNLMWL